MKTESKKVSGFEITALSVEERRVLYLFLFERAEWQIGELCSAMRYKIGNKSYDYPPSSSIPLCERMCAKGFLRPTYEPKTPKSRRYGVLDVRLSVDAARLLLGEAVSKNWIVDSSGWLSYSNRKRDVLTGLASMLNGGKGYAMPRDSWDVVDAVWEESVRFAMFFGADDAMPQMAFPTKVNPFVFRVLSSVLFCRGFDVTFVLEDWHRHLLTKEFDSIGPYDTIEYAALCVWTGHVDWLDALGTCKKDSDEAAFVAACRDFVKGDLASAAKGMAFMDSFLAKRASDYESNLASMPAAHLLALFVVAFEKPESVASSSASENAPEPTPPTRTENVPSSPSWSTPRSLIETFSRSIFAVPDHEVVPSPCSA